MFMFSSPIEVGEKDRKSWNVCSSPQETLGRVGTGERRAQSRIGISRFKTVTPEGSESTF
jgi:hypothetical protein